MQLSIISNSHTLFTLDRYTGLQGSLSKYLHLDNATGVVSMGTETVFDREHSDTHYVSVEVRVGG